MLKMLQVPMTLLLIFGLMGCGTTKTDNEKNTGTETGVDTHETNKGTETGIDTNTNTTDGNADDKLKDNASNDMGTNTTNDHKVELADQVADDVAKMSEVKSANVLVTNANAYVAVVLKEGVNGTEELENKIAEHVRKGNKDFHNVYVSTNPDFVKQTTDYGEKIRAGEPVEGFFEEFSDAVRRVFPDAH